MLGYPRRFQLVMWTVLSLLAVTGLALLPGALELKWEMDVPVHLPAGWRVGVAAFHALGAFGTLCLLGALFALHMRMGWRRQKNLKSGITTVTVLAALALTALGVYYLADEALSLWSSGLHIALGLSGIAAVTWHALLGRRARIARRSRIHDRSPTPIPLRAAESPAPAAAEPPRAVPLQRQGHGG